VIDLGPEGGDGGGTVVATGTPEDIAAVKESYTGQYLGPMLERDKARAGSKAK
jgi:excinuclease ABC subunit A